MWGCRLYDPLLAEQRKTSELTGCRGEVCAAPELAITNAGQARRLFSNRASQLSSRDAKRWDITPTLFGSMPTDALITRRAGELRERVCSGIDKKGHYTSSGL